MYLYSFRGMECLVGYNDNVIEILLNEVDHNIYLDVFQYSVLSNISTAFLHKVVFVCIVHRNNVLFSKHTLDSYVNLRFRFAIIFDYILNVISFIFLVIDDRLFILQEKSLKKTNIFLFYSYNIISFFFN